jgi:hypothetical protein
VAYRSSPCVLLVAASRVRCLRHRRTGTGQLDSVSGRLLRVGG